MYDEGFLYNLIYNLYFITFINMYLRYVITKLLKI